MHLKWKRSHLTWHLYRFTWIFHKITTLCHRPIIFNNSVIYIEGGFQIITLKDILLLYIFWHNVQFSKINFAIWDTLIFIYKVSYVFRLRLKNIKMKNQLVCTWDIIIWYIIYLRQHRQKTKNIPSYMT